MVINGFHSHPALQFVESRSGKTFQQRVDLAGDLHSVHHIVTGCISINHFLYRIQVILQIRINGNNSVTPVFGSHHPCHDSTLVTYVPRQIHSFHVRIFLMQLLDNVPRTVLATIIYKKHEAVRTDLFLPNQFIKQGCQTGG